MKRRRTIGLLRIALCLLPLLPAGCLAPVTSIATDLPSGRWSDAAVLRYANADTLTLRDLRLFVRLAETCGEDTLTVRVETCSPERLRTTEYHRLVFDARQTASAVRPVVERSYRRGVRLRETGDYHFVLTPVRPVQGIEAVGLRVTNR